MPRHKLHVRCLTPGCKWRGIRDSCNSSCPRCAGSLGQVTDSKTVKKEGKQDER